MENIDIPFIHSQWYRCYNQVDIDTRDKLLQNVDFNKSISELRELLINNYIYVVSKIKSNITDLIGIIETTQTSEMHISMELLLLKEL